MSDKLLHERLREAGCGCAEVLDAVNLSCGNIDGCDNCYDMFAKAIADEIERQYIPVPRFPDGEPVREGSETFYGTVSSAIVEMSDGGWGNWVIRLKDGNCIEETFSKRVDRPEPNVLDADGVEVKVGDTVWFCGDDAGAYAVSLVEETLGGGWCLTVYNDAATIHEVRPSQVTHREPDSLEKLLNRMEDYAQKYEGYVDGAKVGDFSKELRALIERDA